MAAEVYVLLQLGEEKHQETYAYVAHTPDGEQICLGSRLSRQEAINAAEQACRSWLHERRDSPSI